MVRYRSCCIRGKHRGCLQTSRDENTRKCNKILVSDRCYTLFFVFVFFGCMVASRGGYRMARGRHYAKLSLSNAARLSFSDLWILLFLFLSLCRLCVCVFLCSHWSLVDVPLIFFCPADHVPDWQPRVLLGMVEARSVNVKKTTTTTTTDRLNKKGLHHTYSKTLPKRITGYFWMLNQRT